MLIKQVIFIPDFISLDVNRESDDQRPDHVFPATVGDVDKVAGFDIPGWWVAPPKCWLCLYEWSPRWTSQFSGCS